MRKHLVIGEGRARRARRAMVRVEQVPCFTLRDVPKRAAGQATSGNKYPDKESRNQNVKYFIVQLQQS